MGQVTIASIVEGDGEVRAVPVLLRRIGEAMSVWGVRVPTPYRMPRTKLLVPGSLENAVQASAHHVREAGGVLVLIDADDDCPASLGPELRERAQAARPDKKIAVVLANREFEAWFLASAPSLAGRRNLPDPLEAPAAPERIRGAKEWLSGRMGRHSYQATVDQAALAAIFDMEAARRDSPSFDKFWREVERLMKA